MARYADTNGYEKDRDRNIWPYRDWVIRAINNSTPFDQFTIEQIAGRRYQARNDLRVDDEFGFHVIDKKVHVHDLQATILHTMGFDHQRLTLHQAGRDFRLTDVHGSVVSDLLA